jgi:hypothetical protein
LAAKKTKDVVEMLGEFLRDAVVLVPIFVLLEVALKDGQHVTFAFVFGVLSFSLLLLILAIICEKMRR